MDEKPNFFLRTRDVVEYKAGDVILEEGGQGECMYGIQSGKVDVILNGKALYSLGAGDIFGEMALIDKGTRSARVVAQTDCVAVRVDDKRFEFMIQQTPNFALYVMRVLVERLRYISSQY